MAQQTRKWNPGDAANAFVRVILSDAWTMLGGVNEAEWQKTLAWFRARCPEAARVVHYAQALARVGGHAGGWRRAGRGGSPASRLRH